MKLYYSPGACSLAAHIVAREAELPVALVRVDLKTKTYEGGGDFLKINPKGYVPTLEMENGEPLTEAAVVLQYLADLQPNRALIPKAPTLERYRCEEWLNFIATELHKGFGPLWKADTTEPAKQKAKEQLAKRFAIVAHTLKSQPYLMGAAFTVADAYLFTILNWTGIHKIDLAPWTALSQFLQRIGQRPSVIAALQAEGLKANDKPATAASPSNQPPTPL